MNSKKPTAIVYTSGTGYTARYAQLLGEKTGLPVYPLKEAARSLPEGTAIIYLGWLMAGTVKGYKKAAARFHMTLLCGVGLGDTGSQLDEVRKNNALPAELPLYTLQGGMDHTKLRGINRLMIRILTKTLTGKAQRTPQEEAMLSLLQKGGDYVREENLSAVLDAIQ